MLSRSVVYRFQIAIILLCISQVSTAQRGPGGVSTDNNPELNCRLWFDASDLSNLSDGSEVILWQDKSVSEISDHAFWSPNYIEEFPAPIFRDAASASINGHPVVSFENGGMLLIGEGSANPSTDLATNPNQYTTYKRTIFIALRTGNDVMARQYIWEQGGGWRGLNIYIYNGEIFMGVYDSRLDNDTGGQVPEFGYSYKTSTVLPNTTYVLALIYNAPTNNSLDYEGNSLTGKINGVSFSEIQHAGNLSPGFGGLGKQDDPIGIGGINSETANESGYLSQDCNGATPCSGNSENTGEYTFKGRITELCYYAYNMNDAERIIVSNYLAAKYTANIIENDKYEFQSNFGNNLIGIGKENENNFHNISQGDNIFEIRVNMSQAFPASTPQYLMVGSNFGLIEWTDLLTPDPQSILRLQKTWRWDRTGDEGGSKKVELRFSENLLPPLPDGFTKYGILLDTSNAPLPEFESEAAQVIELDYDQGLGVYFLNTEILDGAYMSLAAIKPILNFSKTSSYLSETDAVQNISSAVEVKLNYTPTLPGGVLVGFDFIDSSATNPVHYLYSLNQTTIPVGQNTTLINFSIVNNDVQEGSPSRSFSISINQSTTAQGITIGTPSKHVVTIYDDDQSNAATFNSATSTFMENAGTAQLTISLTQAPTNSTIVRIIDNGGAGAEYGIDYILPNTTWETAGEGQHYRDVIFQPGESISQTIQFPIFDDGMAGPVKGIDFTLEPIQNVGVSSSSILEHHIFLTNINPVPLAEFVELSSEGFEVVSDPRIYVKLSAASMNIVTVPFSITGGTATNGATDSESDYTAEVTGLVIFPIGDTLSYLYYDPLTGKSALPIDADGVQETDETIIFELNADAQNAQLGTKTHHTYTIKDYDAFEWRGAAGVGQLRDNTLWLRPDLQVEGGFASIPNFSGRPIFITPSENSYPIISSNSQGINNKRVLRFSGNGCLKLTGSNESDQSIFINSAKSYQRKAFFFVLKLSENVTDEEQVIYEQGGMDKGLNIYVKNNKLYMQAWNTTDDDLDGNETPWGGNNSYAMSSPLSPGTAYVVSCHFDANASSGLRIFINGVENGNYTGNVGPLYSHDSGTAIGGVNSESRFVSGAYPSESGNNFKGDLAEFIYFNEALLNVARVRILHNYFSAKYHIALANNVQYVDLEYANALSQTANFNYDIAGIGLVNDQNLHGDAQGTAQMRINNGAYNGSNAFMMWGHNGDSFAETWPSSSFPMPEGILKRSKRIWKIYKTTNGVVTKADVLFEMNEAIVNSAFKADAKLLRLLIHQNENPKDFGGATIVKNAIIDNGNVARFNSVSIPNGAYVSLASVEENISNTPELLSLSAQVGEKKIELFWATNIEINNDFFQVEKADETNNWEYVTSIYAVGQSTIPQSYSISDSELRYGISYYRIKLFDYDGTFVYSNVVSVKNPDSSFADNIVLFPNPASNGSFFIQMPVQYSGENATIRMYNISGKIVLETPYTANTALKQIRYGNMQAGMYLIRIHSQLLNKSFKLLVE